MHMANRYTANMYMPYSNVVNNAVANMNMVSRGVGNGSSPVTSSHVANVRKANINQVGVNSSPANSLMANTNMANTDVAHTNMANVETAHHHEAVATRPPITA
jgi:uncharacterized protein YwgA